MQSVGDSHLKQQEPLGTGGGVTPSHWQHWVMYQSPI